MNFGCNKKTKLYAFLFFSRNGPSFLKLKSLKRYKIRIRCHRRVASGYNTGATSRKATENTNLLKLVKIEQIFEHSHRNCSIVMHVLFFCDEPHHKLHKKKKITLSCSIVLLEYQNYETSCIFDLCWWQIWYQSVYVYFRKTQEVFLKMRKKSNRRKRFYTLRRSWWRYLS